MPRAAGALGTGPVAQALAPRSATAWLGLFGAYFMFGVGYIAYSTFMGGRLAAAQADTATIVWSWVSLGLGSVAGSVAGAAIVSTPRLKPWALVLASFAGAAGSAAAIQAGPIGPMLGAILVGLGLASTPAIVTAFVRERTTDADYARLFSFGTAALGVGQLLGPLAAGALADRIGPDAVMLFAAAAYGAGAALAGYDLLRRGR